MWRLLRRCRELPRSDWRRCPTLSFHSMDRDARKAGIFISRMFGFGLRTESETNEVKIESAIADFNQQGYGIETAIDSNPKTGWGIHPQVGRPHAAVFKFAEPTRGSWSITGRSRAEPRRVSFDRALPVSGNNLGSLRRAPRCCRNKSRHHSHANRRAVVNARTKIWPGISRTTLWKREMASLPPPKQVYAGAHEFVRDAGHQPIGKMRPVHVLRRGELKLARELAQPGALSCVAGLDSTFKLEILKTRRATRGIGEVDYGPSKCADMAFDREPCLAVSFRSRALSPRRAISAKWVRAPSHPELLDWLAIWFQENGGSFKELHRLILNSAAYQQSSAFNDEFAARDASNRFLWRMNPTRLDAEAVRDAMLAISGKLDLSMGGPSAQQFVMSPGIHVTPSSDYAQI